MALMDFIKKQSSTSSNGPRTMATPWPGASHGEFEIQHGASLTCANRRCVFVNEARSRRLRSACTS